HRTSHSQALTPPLHDALPISTARNLHGHVSVARVDDVQRAVDVAHRDVTVRSSTDRRRSEHGERHPVLLQLVDHTRGLPGRHVEDRKSTRLNSSHVKISYAVF